MNPSQKGRGLSDKQMGVLLIIPGVAIFATIILYPFINSILMSFTNRSMLKPQFEIIGLENYREVFSNPYFFRTLMTTITFVVSATLLPFTLGFIWAIVLNHGFKGAEILRGITLVNWIIPGVAISFLWMWIFNGQYGLLNALFMKFGFIDKNITWLGRVDTALLVVVLARTWQMLPWFMAFLLGGLQGVSTDQLEAARLDGANNWQVFTKIVVPSMKSIISIVLSLGAIGNLQHFDLPWVMAEGGPARATTTLSIEVFRTAFKNWNMGKAATVGTIWAVLLALFSFVYIRQMQDSD